MILIGALATLHFSDPYIIFNGINAMVKHHLGISQCIFQSHCVFSCVFRVITLLEAPQSETETELADTGNMFHSRMSW